MTHQIVIRIVGQIPVYDFAFGKIMDGQFHHLDVNELPVEILDLVTVDSLLGTQAYVRSCDLSSIFHAMDEWHPGYTIQFFPNFIVLEYVTEEEEDEE